MRRIIGEHFKRNGLPKRDWGSQDRAKRAADRHHARAYQCSFCGGWHLATDTNWHAHHKRTLRQQAAVRSSQESDQ
jgi:hypothetical protein